MKTAKVHAHLFARFAFVGAMGVVINLIALYCAVSFMHANYLLGEMVAAGLAAGFNYSLNVLLGVIVPSKARDHEA